MDKSKIAVEVFNKRAKLYEARYMNVDSYAKSLDYFCRQLSRIDADILELACGPGNLTQYLLGQNPQLKILSTDLAPNMIELAKLNCPTATFQLLDCRKISVLEQCFDAIVAGFCLPYLDKEEVLELMSSVKKRLNTVGLFYLSTMEGNYSNSRIQKSSSGDDVFVHYYDRLFLAEALRSENFQILNFWAQPDLTQKEETMDIIFLAKKLE